MEDLRELLGWLENQAWKKGEEQRAPSHSSHLGHSGLPGPGEAAAAAAPEHPMAPQACPPAPAPGSCTYKVPFRKKVLLLLLPGEG